MKTLDINNPRNEFISTEISCQICKIVGIKLYSLNGMLLCSICGFYNTKANYKKK